MTRSGHFNPVFKEAPHASQCVLEGMASRQGVCRASQTMMRHRHVGVIGGARKRFCVSVVGFDPVISGPLLPDGVMRTHGCRCMLPTVSNREFPVQAVPLSLYRHKPCWRSTDA